jgi:hypothetical protein
MLLFRRPSDLLHSLLCLLQLSPDQEHIIDHGTMSQDDTQKPRQMHIQGLTEK